LLVTGPSCARRTGWFAAGASGSCDWIPQAPPS